ncbi:diaminopimelate epimerase [Daejeonella sp.]|uniref:diaminopimelate epimerase n=1 Tax=Daejeonella sp. TaxID=2805397 RepID=UPI0030C1FB45
MNLRFYKYEGAGNDFIVLDNRKGEFNSSLNPEAIKKMCDRHFGIGADGLMALQLKDGYDFEMLYFNANGNEGTMCGNGGRCIVAFAEYLRLINGETNFLAVDGLHYAKISEKGGWVSLKMIDVTTVDIDNEAMVLNTGSPHYVLLTNDLQNKDVFKEGQGIRYSDRYVDAGINVNFVEDMGTHYFVRTYERGVENETYACGTGVTAVAMAMAKTKSQTGDIATSLRVLGGDLKVRFNYDGKSFTEVFLEGPATFVFEGAIKL